MSRLAALSGVPAATIKHYLREGLLPGAEVRASRNMAFYDPQLAERIKQIKQLQREHFLPLRAIKSVLEGKPSEDDDEATRAAIQRALDSMSSAGSGASPPSCPRSELLASGHIRERDLSFFEALGLITPPVDDRYTGDDLALLRVLETSRREGITADMLPREIIGPYVQAIGQLVQLELEMFRKGVAPRAGADLPRLTDVATRLSEQLVVLLRRKMLLPTLTQIVEEAAQAERKAATRPSTKKKKTKPTTTTTTTTKNKRSGRKKLEGNSLS